MSWLQNQSGVLVPTIKPLRYWQFHSIGPAQMIV